MIRTRVYTAIITTGMLALLLAAVTGKAEAGKPRYNYSGEKSNFDKPLVIDNASTAFTYYAELVPGEVDTYQVYATAGQAANVAMAAPKAESFKDFTPAMALVGPGIDTNVDTTTLPVPLPVGMGAVVLNYTGDTAGRQSALDAVTTTASWLGQQYKATYPENGAYYILVWDSQNRGGKYIMTVGADESLGLFDLVKFPYTWAKLNIWFGNWLNLLVVVVVLLATVFLVARTVTRKRAQIVYADLREVWE
ncbi:MAG: hypothetical protein ABI670_09550 [Chloroflexota bacterium]